MVNCPRCAQPVDETVRNRCPLCFTAIPQSSVITTPEGLQNRGVPMGLSGMPDPALFQNDLAAIARPGLMVQNSGLPPPSPAPPSILAPGSRLSLAGDVIHSNDPPNILPNYVAGAATNASINAAHSGGKAQKRRMEGSLPGEAGDIQRSGGMLGTVMALVVFLGAAIGVWFLWTHRTNPKDQAMQIVRAFASKDWKSSYDLVAFGDAGKKQCPDSDAFGKQADKLFSAFASNPRTKPILADLAQATDNMTVGEPVLAGDKAEVPTSIPVKTDSPSLTLKGKVRLINEGGLWKLDMTSSSQTERDRTIRDLIGSPDSSGFGG